MHRLQQGAGTSQALKKRPFCKAEHAAEGKKMAPGREPEKNSGLGRCISLLKDDLSIGRIAAGITCKALKAFLRPPACLQHLSLPLS